jgi:broad specificity phosphatase PhoE
MPVSPWVMRPRRSTAVASTNTAPAPPCANLPRCTKCQSVTWPSCAEYWHIGEMTMRLRRRTPRSSIGWKRSGVVMSKLCRRMAVMRIVALALLLLAFPVSGSDELWDLLRGGGQVVLIRHPLTTPGAGDPQGFRLEDCSTQRNLSEEGRDHAKRIGEAFRLHRVPVERVLTSPWCRCVETASLAFGKAEISPALANLFGRSESRQKQVDELTAMAGERRAGGNLVLVTHGSTILALTRIPVNMGEIMVLTPHGEGRFALAGRFTVP